MFLGRAINNVNLILLIVDDGPKEMPTSKVVASSIGQSLINSKRESILNAIHKMDIRALVVSETYAVGKEVPVLDKTMEAFFKNRSDGQNKGGVSIFLEKTLAKHSVVVGKSDYDHEWVAVKINYFDPPVVLIGLYGCQSSKNTVAQLNEKWTELWEFAGQYKDTATVIVCGDANAAIGNKANMRNN